MHTAATRPEPPAPRSKQLQAAAAAGLPAGTVPPPRNTQAPTSPSAPRHYRGAPAPSAAAVLAAQGQVDFGKFRTKLCRNFMMGIPCPFEDRCVFAHGEDQLAPHEHDASAPRSQTSAAGGSMEFPAGTMPAGMHMQGAMMGGYYGSGSASDDGEGVTAGPPTYESFIASASGYLDGSDPSTPTAPIRYRHDPYRPEGIVYKYC